MVNFLVSPGKLDPEGCHLVNSCPLLRKQCHPVKSPQIIIHCGSGALNLAQPWDCTGKFKFLHCRFGFRPAAMLSTVIFHAPPR